MRASSASLASRQSGWRWSPTGKSVRLGVRRGPRGTRHGCSAIGLSSSPASRRPISRQRLRDRVLGRGRWRRIKSRTGAKPQCSHRSCPLDISYLLGHLGGRIVFRWAPELVVRSRWAGGCQYCCQRRRKNGFGLMVATSVRLNHDHFAPAAPSRVTVPGASKASQSRSGEQMIALKLPEPLCFRAAPPAPSRG